MKKKFGLISMLTLAACQPTQNAPSPTGVAPQKSSQSVIYGDDDRLDLYQTSDDGIKALAQSTVALISKNDLTSLSSQSTLIRTEVFGEALQLCEGEPFWDQPIAPFCTGFLVGSDLVVTAGHCIQTQQRCEDTEFVFGFSVEVENQYPTQVPTDDVYSCTRLIHSEANSLGADFAVVQLDRPVQGRSPLKLRREGQLKTNDPLTIMGHPSGLPTKIAGGASVRELKEEYFVANLDSYGGNSGSPVFHQESGVIEGILVRGERDFVFEGNCRVSHRCTQSGCRGEDVTLISEVLPHLPETSLPGESRDVIYEARPELSIPDANMDGVFSEMVVDQAPNGRKVFLWVNIEHSYQGDLEISLTPPNGENLLLKKSEMGNSQDNLVGTFGKELISFDSLASLSEITRTGVWSLKVADQFRLDQGALLQWKLIFEGAPPLQEETFEKEELIPIPDNDSTGVHSTLSIPIAVHGRKVEVSFNLTHTYRGDLQIMLHSPSGKILQLKAVQKVDSTPNVVGTYGVDLPSVDDLSVLHAEPAGNWKLQISDELPQDHGELRNWKLIFRTP